MTDSFVVIKSDGTRVPQPRPLDEDRLQWLWDLKARERWVVEENARIDALEAERALQAAAREVERGEPAQPSPSPAPRSHRRSGPK